ncbi:hypothetical protein FCOIX_8819 [Fusarium coicis]|nr:hypothetical protein FCOIX_8819 [Fusarium coicis]
MRISGQSGIKIRHGVNPNDAGQGQSPDPLRVETTSREASAMQLRTLERPYASEQADHQDMPHIATNARSVPCHTPDEHLETGTKRTQLRTDSESMAADTLGTWAVKMADLSTSDLRLPNTIPPSQHAPGLQAQADELEKSWKRDTKEAAPQEIEGKKLAEKAEASEIAGSEFPNRIFAWQMLLQVHSKALNKNMSSTTRASLKRTRSTASLNVAAKILAVPPPPLRVVRPSNEIKGTVEWDFEMRDAS